MKKEKILPLIFHFDLSFEPFQLILKKNIVDTKGNFITESIKNSKSKSNLNEVNYSQNSEIDADLEDSFGKLMFTQYRIRFAYQRAFQSQKTKSLSLLIRGLIFSLILGIAVILFTGIFFSNYFVSRIEDQRKSHPLENFINSYLSILDIILIQELNQIRIDIQPVLGEGVFDSITSNQEMLSKDILNFSNDFRSELDKWILRGIKSLNELQSEIILQAHQGVNVQEIFFYLFNLR